MVFKVMYRKSSTPLGLSLGVVCPIDQILMLTLSVGSSFNFFLGEMWLLLGKLLISSTTQSNPFPNYPVN
jgi:uncharacterized membrane protein